MEIQVGEYVRTKDGIKKIIKVNEGSNATYYGEYIVEPKYKGSNSINAKNIIKHSFNITEILEEGDYINGNLVLEIGLTYLTTGIEKHFKVVEQHGYLDVLKKHEIKSILTKEQFKAMEYEIK